MRMTRYSWNKLVVRFMWYNQTRVCSLTKPKLKWDKNCRLLKKMTSHEPLYSVQIRLPHNQNNVKRRHNPCNISLHLYVIRYAHAQHQSTLRQTNPHSPLCPIPTHTFQSGPTLPHAASHIIPWVVNRKLFVLPLRQRRCAYHDNILKAQQTFLTF